MKQLEPREREKGSMSVKSRAKEEAKQQSVRADDVMERYKVTRTPLRSRRVRVSRHACHVF